MGNGNVKLGEPKSRTRLYDKALLCNNKREFRRPAKNDSVTIPSAYICIGAGGGGGGEEGCMRNTPNRQPTTVLPFSDHGSDHGVFFQSTDS